MAAVDYVEFEEPDLPNSYNSLSLVFTFEEVRERGQERFKCRVTVEEIGDSVLTMYDDFDSWEQLKEKYPTFNDLIEKYKDHEYWANTDPHTDLVLYVESATGATGLYDLSETPQYISQSYASKRKNKP